MLQKLYLQKQIRGYSFIQVKKLREKKEEENMKYIGVKRNRDKSKKKNLEKINKAEFSSLKCLIK